MSHEEFGENVDFNISQLPESAYLLDPDGILRYTMELLNAERGEEEARCVLADLVHKLS